MRADHASPSVDGTDKRRCTMQTTRSIRRVAAAGLAALATTVAACSGSSGDRAGGADAPEPRVLRLANPNDAFPPAQIDSWAEEVSRLSGGTLEIEFKNGWRLGEPLFEAGTLEDVTAGKVEMAWVGSRVFDTVGVTSFQALVAPLLVDSYDLERAVFEDGIPEQMLEGVSELDLVGIGVLPGPLRKVLGMSKPFLRPGDFEGQVVGLQDSAVADASLSALGATPRAMPSGAELDGLDAYEQQLGAIWGNRYYKSADYVGANVNLWPRPLVIVMGEEAFESLTAEQQAVLREAATAAVPESLAAARAEDDEAALQLCRFGLTFEVASEGELAELRTALEPVYVELRADPETMSNIDAITNLKTEVAAAADAPVCTSTEPSATASPIPYGTYETTVTEDDYRKAGVSEEVGANPGVFRMIFDAGEWTFIGPIRDGEPKDTGEQGDYGVYRDQIEVHIAEDVTITARWSLDGKTLTFTDVDCPPCGGKPGALGVIWESHPWVKID
jgi:TRAP-type C4-dicarboxylate transport system substrate-binding protein